MRVTVLRLRKVSINSLVKSCNRASAGHREHNNMSNIVADALDGRLSPAMCESTLQNRHEKYAISYNIWQRAGPWCSP